MAELARLPDATLITVRCSTTVLDAVESPAGLIFPRDANRFAVNGATTIMWTGPDDWLIITDDTNAVGLQQALETAFAHRHAAVVDVSGNRVRFHLSGDGARDMMARACALDLDPPHFSAGHCAGTLIARVQAFVLQRDNGPSYEILMRRSVVKYLSDWFDAAGCYII